MLEESHLTPVTVCSHCTLPDHAGGVTPNPSDRLQYLSHVRLITFTGHSTLPDHAGGVTPNPSDRLQYLRVMLD
ncbi:hypothetical protein J6590_070844 [Homalodisca vitripennis]|nr:hypothetical protein J6590_070844 [Homalodisca vitripennis]